jgi:phage terminase large subunit-like protein
VSAPDRTAEIVARMGRLPEEERLKILRALKGTQSREFVDRWEAWAHEGQTEPEGDWSVWLIRAGRGFGKTRAGAEWVSDLARTMPDARIALVGATADDVRAVMIEGQSGLIAVARDDEVLKWRAASGEVEFPSGAKAFVYSAEAPDKLRGPEHHAAWCDEIAKWRYGDSAWDNLMFGLRLGDRPRVLVTTTPKAVALLYRVMARRGVIEFVGKTRDNKNLAESVVAALEEEYGGTRLGRQELDGELIDDVPGALWTRAMIEGCRVAAAPALVRTVVAVDPPAGSASRIGGDECGIVACGIDEAGVAYVIEDASVAGASPEGWARAVAECAARVQADRVVAEKNQGGEMVRHVLEGASGALPVTLVHASKGKAARAEPVAVRYERGEVKHVGAFPALEDQLCGLSLGGGYQGPGRSPDRADALVWGLTELLLGRRKRASVRVIR